MAGTSGGPTLATADPTLLAFADDVGSEGPIAVAGGRTRWQTGGPLAGADVRVVTAPTGVVEYVPEEMIVTVRCGTSTAELNAELATRGQRTGLPDRGGTVGGALAVGENHLEVLGRGTVRSALLQVRYVSAEGRVVTGGGPTVKNVTGFDLPRLMVGSLGTLGCLAEVIIRTNPIPAVSQWFECSEAEPSAVLETLLAPSAVLWDGTTTSVLLEGHGPDVAGQAARLGALGSFAECDAKPEPPGCRWSLPPGELSQIDRHDTGAFVAAFGVGTVFAENPQPERPLTPAVQALNERVKFQFDPTGRLNPGRDPQRR